MIKIIDIQISEESASALCDLLQNDKLNAEFFVGSGEIILTDNKEFEVKLSYCD